MAFFTIETQSHRGIAIVLIYLNSLCLCVSMVKIEFRGELMTINATSRPGTPVLLGIPFDANSSWLRGASGAPPIIRVAFRSDSSNFWTETGIDLGAEGAYRDAGDLEFTSNEPFTVIERRVE